MIHQAGDDNIETLVRYGNKININNIGIPQNNNSCITSNIYIRKKFALFHLKFIRMTKLGR